MTSVDNSPDKPLFLQEEKNVAILLVDYSGSTTWSCNIPGRQEVSIFARMYEICQDLGYKKYHVIFWTSPSANKAPFNKGILKIPYEITPEKLELQFKMAMQANCQWGTCPFIGFAAIDPAWLKKNPAIYFITDGQIGCSEYSEQENKSRLVAEIKKQNCPVHIIAVEGVERTFANAEQVDSAAGGDIYKLVRENNLSNKISSFICYDTKSRHTQIDKAAAPAGYAPYGSQYFSLARIPEFIKFVREKIAECKTDDDQIAIAHKLSSTIAVVVKEKSPKIIKDTIKMFARLFTIDENMVTFVLEQAVADEIQGQAQVFASVRSKLKNLFEQAATMLKTDVANAIGIQDEFVSVLFNGRLLTGPSGVVNKAIVSYGDRYPRGGFVESMPVFPLYGANFDENKVVLLQDQCLRQWIRVVLAPLYKVNPMDDAIIYLMLGLNAIINNSDVRKEIKDAYRLLAKCILRKKRLRSDRTEYEYLVSGELPCPNNGNYDKFIGIMNNVVQKLGLNVSALNLWYNCCVAIGDDMISAQRKHCNNETSLLPESKIIEDKVPDGFAYDYNCIISLDDISAVGGYKFKPHEGNAGWCYPVYLVSEESYNQMIEHKNAFCPICYHVLGPNDFEKVGPRVEFKLPAEYENLKTLFDGKGKYYNESNNVSSSVSSSVSGNVSSSSVNSSSHQSFSSESLKNKNGKKGRLIIMKGVVGSGKSTWAQEIKTIVEARGGVCLIAGTDKYCKNGMSVPEAIEQIKKDLESVREMTNDDIVVIIDTCGDRQGPKCMQFNVDFTGWKTENLWPNCDRSNLRGYFAWSLRNVLMRTAPDEKSNYWLSGATVPHEKCISIHYGKARGLFTKRYELNECSFIGATIDSLRELAEAYEKTSVGFVKPDYL